MALVLSRRIGEGIQIGPDIMIRFVERKGANEWKLLIDAPQGMDIIRLSRADLSGAFADHDYRPGMGDDK